jgi:hypothetical protein
LAPSVFGLANKTQPAFDSGVTTGQYANRETLESLVEDVLPKFPRKEVVSGR